MCWWKPTPAVLPHTGGKAELRDMLSRTHDNHKTLFFFPNLLSSEHLNFKDALETVPASVAVNTQQAVIGNDIKVCHIFKGFFPFHEKIYFSHIVKQNNKKPP